MNHVSGDFFPTNLISHYMLSFKRLCLATIAFPVLSILVCLITAILFQAEDVHETHCRVYNVIPSISAITGISPQRYLWRISIAFHVCPRFLMAAVSKSYHESKISAVSEKVISNNISKWMCLAFWLQIIEIIALCGVTYISNVENYPLHEKLFITFMISSLTHMLANIKVTTHMALSRGEDDVIHKVLTFKKRLFYLSLLSTVGLVVFFLEHRYLCHNMAFSWFAFCEYVIAAANMVYHSLVIFDFPTEQVVVISDFQHKTHTKQE